MHFIKDKLKEINSKNVISTIIIIIYIIISLFPLLKSGYYFDDSINSYTKGIIKYENKSLWELTYFYFISWIKNQGRFFPFAWYVYTVYTVLNSLILYKIFILISVVINIFLFSCILIKISGSKSITYLCILLIPIMIQFRYYHDPVLSYHFLLQILLSSILLSLIFFHKYLVNKSLNSIIISCGFYLFALCTYEISYVFFVLYFILALFISKNVVKSFKFTAPFFGLAIFFIGLSFYLRSGLKSFGDGYTINIDFLLYLKTLFVQTISSFPLSYFIFNPSGIFSHDIMHIIENIALADLVLGSFIFYFTIIIIKKIEQKLNYLFLLTFGLFLAILPGVLISSAPKHQSMVIGIGYLPVYIQYFGITIIIIAIIAFIVNKFSYPKLKIFATICFAALLSLTSMINIQNNRLVVEKLNIELLYPREILQKSLENAILHDIPKGATIITENENSWDNKYFYYLYTNNKYNVINKNEFIIRRNQEDLNENYALLKMAGENVYIVKYFSINEENGYAKVGKIDNIIFDKLNNDIIQININQLRLFVTKDSFNVLLAKIYSTTIGKTITYPFKALNEYPIQENIKYNMYSLDLNNNILDFDSLTPIKMDLISDSIFNKKDISFSKPVDENNILSTGIDSLIHFGLNENRLLYDFVSDNFVGVDNSADVIAENGSLFTDYSGPIIAKALELTDRYTIELLIKPERNQNAYAHIIGNHPGTNGFEGFVLQMDNNNENSYTFSYGNGHEWISTPSFKLNEEDWNYIIVCVDINKISIYNNGILISSVNTNGSIKNSELPLYIGNWINSDRAFKGIVKEVKISRKSMEMDSISKNWLSISKRLNIDNSKYVWDDSLKINPKSIFFDKYFTIQVLVKPYSKQIPFAHILGNHPGYNNFEGFVIQMDSANNNVYSFAYGNGIEWLESIKFKLDPDVFSLLTITVKDKYVTIYVNDKIAGSRTFIDNIRNSAMPLYIGDWVNGGRHFQGEIKRINIFPEAFLIEDIVDSWDAVVR